MTWIDREIDDVARHLATNAGIIWETLGNYPGYAKNCWRERALAMIQAFEAAEKRARDSP